MESISFFFPIIFLPSGVILVNSFIPQENLRVPTAIVAVKQENRWRRQCGLSHTHIVETERYLVGSTVNAKLADTLGYYPPTQIPVEALGIHRVLWVGSWDDISLIHVKEAASLLKIMIDQIFGAGTQSSLVEKLMKYFFGLSMKEPNGEHVRQKNSDCLIPGDVDGEGWNGFGEGRWVLTNHLPIIIGEDKAFVWTILVPSRCFGEVTKLFHPETDFFGVVSLVNDLFEFLSEFTNEELMP